MLNPRQINVVALQDELGLSESPWISPQDVVGGARLEGRLRFQVLNLLLGEIDFDHYHIIDEMLGLASPDNGEDMGNAESNMR